MILPVRYLSPFRLSIQTRSKLVSNEWRIRGWDRPVRNDELEMKESTP